MSDVFQYLDRERIFHCFVELNHLLTCVCLFQKFSTNSCLNSSDYVNGSIVSPECPAAGAGIIDEVCIPEINFNA